MVQLKKTKKKKKLRANWFVWRLTDDEIKTRVTILNDRLEEIRKKNKK